jgi:hypothetical protein
MIAAVKGWFAVLSALLFILPTDAQAADDLNGAARELARKTAAFAGRGETLAITWRNLSSLNSSDLSQVRAAVETALRESGSRLVEGGGAAEARLTLSQNQSQYLVMAEARKGEERQTFIASWKRPAAAGPISTAAIVLDRKLLWEQTDPILDVAITPSAMLVLSPARLTLYARGDGSFQERQTVAIAPPRSWPRDPRAHLRLTGTSFRAFLPGALCTGAIDPALTLECRPSDELWTLESGSRTVLLAGFAPGRNHFDGHVVTQTGARKNVPPFYTAGAVEPFWVFTLVDGRTQIFDSNFEPAGSVAGWGSDVAATDARCGGGTQILATKAGDSHEPDAIRAYSMVNRTPVPLTAPVEFPGPITALWTANGVSAIAVVQDLSTGRYQAYLLTVLCA